MTSEIAILNKSAVALAADSAVTIQNQHGAKVYNTVNKLFTLSKYAPIGVMIYGDAEIAGVPWETIIKSYRESLGAKTFDHLENYASHFIEFIQDNDTTFSPELQKAALKDTVKGYGLALLNQRAKSEAKESGRDLVHVFSEVIAAERDSWDGRERLPTAPSDLEQRIRDVYEEDIASWIREVYPEANDKAVQDFVELTTIMHAQDGFGPKQSGIVFAGFGSRDIFPQMRTYLFEGYIVGYGKHREEEKKAGHIGPDNNASITPFAQSDDALTFIMGMAPNYGLLLDGLLKGLFDSFQKVLPIASDLEGVDAEELAKSLATHSDNARNRFERELREFQQKNHVGPILNMVSVLPKDELAVMAESLVHLTTLKKRFTMDTESVGGPVDVAVISKGDGFVWIKRKHYFDIKYNPHFATNYFRHASEEKP